MQSSTHIEHSSKIDRSLYCKANTNILKVEMIQYSQCVSQFSNTVGNIYH